MGVNWVDRGYCYFSQLLVSHENMVQHPSNTILIVKYIPTSIRLINNGYHWYICLLGFIYIILQTLCFLLNCFSPYFHKFKSKLALKKGYIQR